MMTSSNGNIYVTENVKDLTLPMNAMSSTTTSQVLHPGRGVLVVICISSNAKPIKPISKYRFITPNMI